MNFSDALHDLHIVRTENARLNKRIAALEAENAKLKAVVEAGKELKKAVDRVQEAINSNVTVKEGGDGPDALDALIKIWKEFKAALERARGGQDGQG